MVSHIEVNNHPEHLKLLASSLLSLIVVARPFDLPQVSLRSGRLNRSIANNLTPRLYFFEGDAI
jgi:hypothetical protein